MEIRALAITYKSTKQTNGWAEGTGCNSFDLIKDNIAVQYLYGVKTKTPRIYIVYTSVYYFL